ncbi:dihydrodipicolinate reductase [Paraglaciecola sp. T6c]|uniref:4-hydroxy-tetrahydrodipicolinate reductase n=1 Tax=Pseudoalteromonas atlantica (strain T6c / ATCC BAA-1087) TaxID=3042615 RepID=DAPB_PSEA6|nr:4-hydroxy-tetrahydrodipicolinate reductase [Paraglaciecola sp. T6c]Q15TQ4.1 RecName: Full=4-hydroxy-tetrahydrodipicolinate reductase; Short=HTPA reductase [Paraglaciecola sp. T6c]ABG40734.1 dihydrodipicolinate reductase [Paraglaciecola sp. T6c]
MNKIAIFGANGRMGRVLIEAIDQSQNATLNAAFVRASSSMMGVDVGELAGIGQRGLTVTDANSADFSQIDIVIDFTLPEALEANLALCVQQKKPVVIGTTGLNQQQKDALQRASQHIPIVFAANYSIGVNLLLNLARQTARVMGGTADIEIIEGHHRFKKDAPSGTAVAIGEVIADELGRDLSTCAVYGREGDTGERDQQTIGFATVRAGDIVGEHTALFADIGERIELTHKASSRLTFANGAVKAAVWLKNKSPGLYDMQDVLGLA